MIKIIYLVILVYFIVGGLGFYLINRNKPTAVSRKSYTKFGVYFIIINVLFWSIAIDVLIFRYISLFIIVAGFSEVFKLFWLSGFNRALFFCFSLFVFAAFSIGFYLFSGFDKEVILFSFLVLSIFDSFSQITGQLWGRTKILPNISPNKTLGGLVGGFLISIISGFLLKKLFIGSITELLIFSIGIVVFALFGDVLASFYKRKYKVKDFSDLIPGHGGFIDRFDSLIAGGAWAALYFQCIAS